ncbi:preprotein translocase subunit SecA [Williamsoniiplasma somnilux]|uniref:Protein translocase subunit SecA n=1 Tax=Williamsoniiplasma somnilux TaxID=215578 RepID=A0A2K8NZR3_9MOLU|nr:preprotein translocase subunit SecA [Williamsoniiplasma somnilux]ATZ19036.1 preprotein translocase subunit SecA [Williamsoniiplasma somnilux]
MATDKKIIKQYGKVADQIMNLESEMSKLKDEDFKLKTEEFKDRLAKGETLENLLVEAYAVAREASRRVLGLNAYRVQLIGSIILHYGDIAEMKTGEGKTLAGLFPAYLNSLTGKGVHIVTVNEYLSKRDSEINGQVYDLLGITVGLNVSRSPKNDKRIAYAQDVTYTTNAELGFDYLRDNMVQDKSHKVQRGLNFAIIDEADSVLIDEARTPLIISGGSSNKKNMYILADSFAKKVDEKTEIQIDLESKQVFLNDLGMAKAHEFFSVHNLFAVENTELFHLIMNALKANYTFKEGVEYAVKDNEIQLIDQFTGRIMIGRSYSDGLQQAIQAKENVEIEEETTALATITYQNFYRLYAKLSGMTGTAKTEEEEFLKIYNTRVISTPTNRPIIRKDEEDFTFATKNATLKKLIADIKEINEIGNPILIGTTSVESSEQISRYLTNAGLKYEMINAKNHDREAEIVANAGIKGAITLATNMAGRGTDIKLTDEVKKLGGLVVFGVERNEARRIDNQLRGRSGRQGDPGRSRFYISMEDDMMVRFTSPKMRQNFLRLGDDHIKSKMFTRSVTNAQKKLEGMNFDQRKDVLDYDNILAQQREAMYAQRDEVLYSEDLKNALSKFQYTVAYELILENSKIVLGEKTIDGEALLKAIDGILVKHNQFKPKDFEGKERYELAKELANAMMDFYKIRILDIPEDVVISMERATILEAFDKYWTKHIDIASKLRSGIYLQQYAQNNPLAEYVEQATKLYNKMKINISMDICDRLSKVVIKTVDAEEKPKQIEITDKDIDEILIATGIEKSQLNAKEINTRINELIVEAKDNIQLVNRLNIQRDILLGLVIEIQKRIGEVNNRKIEMNPEDLKNIAKKFDIFNIDEMTIEQINAGYTKLMNEVPTHEESLKMEIEIGRQILTSLHQELSILKNIKKSDQEYIINDEDNKEIKKRIRRKKDGDGAEVAESSEAVKSRSKIG